MECPLCLSFLLRLLLALVSSDLSLSVELSYLLYVLDCKREVLSELGPAVLDLLLLDDKIRVL